MRLIAVMALAVLVTTGCASKADLDRVRDEAAQQQRAAAHYRERANNAEAHLRQMQAELRVAKQQVVRAKKACQPATSRSPASKGSETDRETIENCVMRMIARDGGSPREWRRACGSFGR